MKTIFLRTLETTIKKVTLIVCALVGIGCGIIVNKLACSYEAGAFTQVLSKILTVQHLIFFFAIDGAILIAFTIESASGMVSNEVHEGTFRLLIAKPNTRKEVLLGKVLGTFAGLMILQLVMLFCYYSVIALGSCIDGNITKEMMRYFLPYLLYGTIVIVIWLGLSTILSVIFKRKITSMLPLLAVMILTLGFFPIQRLVSALSGRTLGDLIYFVDTNYQFSMIFRTCVELVDKIPANDAFVYLNNLFTNLYIDNDLSRMDYMTSVMYENNFFNGLAVTIFYLVVSLCCLVASFFIIEKKDV